jgi:hypothetical protein
VVEQKLHSATGAAICLATSKSIPLDSPHNQQGIRKPEPYSIAEAVCLQTVDRLAILKQANDVVDGNPGTFQYRISAPHARPSNDISIGLRDRADTWMVRPALRGVNTGGQAFFGCVGSFY